MHTFTCFNEGLLCVFVVWECFSVFFGINRKTKNSIKVYICVNLLDNIYLKYYVIIFSIFVEKCWLLIFISYKIKNFWSENKKIVI